MTEVANQLAALVANMKHTIEELKEKHLKPVLPPEDPPAKPIVFDPDFYDPDEEFRQVRIVQTVDDLAMPRHPVVAEPGLDEDEIYRWQRWTR